MQNDFPHSGRFEGSQHRFALRVYFEDTDAGGVVYHANYLRFMERGRSDMLRVAGMDQRDKLESGEGSYVVAELTIRYLRPAKLDDDLVVVSELRKLSASSCVIHQRVMRDAETLTDATVVAVFVGMSGRPKRQPRAWIEIFERLLAIDLKGTDQNDD